MKNKVLDTSYKSLLHVIKTDAHERFNDYPSVLYFKRYRVHNVRK